MHTLPGKLDLVCPGPFGRRAPLSRLRPISPETRPLYQLIKTRRRGRLDAREKFAVLAQRSCRFILPPTVTRAPDRRIGNGLTRGGQPHAGPSPISPNVRWVAGHGSVQSSHEVFDPRFRRCDRRSPTLSSCETS